VNAYVAQGRMEEAHALFNRLLALCSDLGLLAEEYDATTGRQVGNFPQAFSHLSLINSASILSAGRITTMGAAPLPGSVVRTRAGAAAPKAAKPRAGSPGAVQPRQPTGRGPWRRRGS
jgi:hypothetical protein